MFTLQPPRHIPTLPDSDLQSCWCDVRSAPGNGQVADIAAGPKRANIGGRTKQKPRDIGDASSLLTPRLLLLSPDEP